MKTQGWCWRKTCQPSRRSCWAPLEKLGQNSSWGRACRGGAEPGLVVHQRLEQISGSGLCKAPGLLDFLSSEGCTLVALEKASDCTGLLSDWWMEAPCCPGRVYTHLSEGKLHPRLHGCFQTFVWREQQFDRKRYGNNKEAISACSAQHWQNRQLLSIFPDLAVYF